MRSSGVVGLVLLVAAASWGAPADAQESSVVLTRRVHELIAREDGCDQRARAAQQRRLDAADKPYVTPEAQREDWDALERARDAEQACADQAAADLLKALAALEIQCGQERSAECAQWARVQRLQRTQLQTFRTMQAGCEQQARNTETFIKRQVASPGYTQESSRTYRDQAKDVELFEQERRKQLACADTARMEQARLRAALKGGAGGAPSRAAYERELALLLTGLQRVSRQIDDRSRLRFDEFTTQMAGFKRELEAFKARHAALLSAGESRVLAAKLLEAGEAVIASAETWRRAGAAKDPAERDAILKDVAVQWQAFKGLVREAATLGGGK